MNGARVAGDFDAAIGEQFLQDGGGVQSGLVHGENEFARSAVGGKRAADDDELGAGFAREREVGFHFGGRRDNVVLDVEVGRGRRDFGFHRRLRRAGRASA